MALDELEDPSPFLLEQDEVVSYPAMTLLPCWKGKQPPRQVN